jgi:hypothetical protein
MEQSRAVDPESEAGGGRAGGGGDIIELKNHDTLKVERERDAFRDLAMLGAFGRDVVLPIIGKASYRSLAMK